MIRYVCSRICNSDDVQKLQEDLNTLQEWAHTWQMKFNIQKCKVMRVGDSDSGLKRESEYSMVKRTFVVKTPEVMLNLYKTLVRPLLEYCISAWSPHCQKDKKLLEKVQHRFTRMITSLELLQYEARLQKLGLWTLEECRNQADLIEVLKMAHVFLLYH